ncbi:hypothetical protein, partial [Azospirillum picis]
TSSMIASSAAHPLGCTTAFISCHHAGTAKVVPHPVDKVAIAGKRQIRLVLALGICAVVGGLGAGALLAGTAIRCVAPVAIRLKLIDAPDLRPQFDCTPRHA